MYVYKVIFILHLHQYNIYNEFSCMTIKTIHCASCVRSFLHVLQAYISHDLGVTWHSSNTLFPGRIINDAVWLVCTMCGCVYIHACAHTRTYIYTYCIHADICVLLYIFIF